MTVKRSATTPADLHPNPDAAELERLREAAGLSQPGLAELAGMNQYGVAKLEQGVREPTWATVQALARALGVDCTAFQDEAAPPAKGNRKRK
jgi:transcriptional regulator with XRE-family HTH domain